MCTTEITKEVHVHTEIVAVSLKVVSSDAAYSLLSKLLATDRYIGVSLDLAAIANVLLEVPPHAEVESKGLFQLFKTMVCDVSNGYHRCSATTKRTALNEDFDMNDVSLEVGYLLFVVLIEPKSHGTLDS